MIHQKAPASTIVGHPAVQQTLRRIEHLTKAVLTIGGWPHSSLLAHQLRQLGELDELMARGVIGEFGSVLIDSDGRDVPALAGRLIGITVEQIRQVPLVVGVGGGAQKLQALCAVLRSGLCDVIITDAQSARAVLELSRRDGN